MMSKQFTASEVKEAGSVEKGLHIIIDNNVYEMGSFVDEHPGGAKILKRVGGKDASKQFWKVSGVRILCGLRRLRQVCYELRFMSASLVSMDGRCREVEIPRAAIWLCYEQSTCICDCAWNAACSWIEETSLTLLRSTTTSQSSRSTRTV